jgi:TetR/AcrR family transcriptional regulator
MGSTRQIRSGKSAGRLRAPGRPAGGELAVRRALLEAARQLFLARGFAAVSIREIAAAAGATPAMIRYYFGDKLGLYRAMLEEATGPLREALLEMRQQAAVTGADIATLMGMYMRLLADNPWLPALIVQEVLSESGRFRAQFIEHFAGRMAPLLMEVLQRERAAGRLRSDVDPRLATVSAISLCVFPFVSLPITSRVLGLSVEGEALDRLAAHTSRLFLEGLSARAASS